MKLRAYAGLFVAAVVTTTAAAQTPHVTDRALAAPPPIVRTMRLPPPPPPPESIAVPNGSYLASCQNVRIEGGQIKASCVSHGDVRRETSISAAACAGASDISNRSGVLVCVTPVRANWGGTVLPPGSYLASCSGFVNDTTLGARCLTGSGDVSILGIEVAAEGTRVTSLDLARCPDGSDIANLHGDLTCVAR